MVLQVIQYGIHPILRENSAEFLLTPFGWSFNFDLEWGFLGSPDWGNYRLCAGHGPKVGCDNSKKKKKKKWSLYD